MLAQIETLRFTPGRRKEGLERLGWMHSLMLEAEGFREALIAKYLGDATRFLVLRYWEDAASYAHFRGGFMRDHAAGRPAGLYEIEESLSCQCISEHNGELEGTANFLVRTHRRVPEAAWDAYVAFSSENERTLNFSFGGLAQQRKLKANEGPDVVNVFRYAGRDDFERYFESVAHEQRTHQWPEGVELVSTRCYELVAET